MESAVGRAHDQRIHPRFSLAECSGRPFGGQPSGTQRDDRGTCYKFAAEPQDFGLEVGQWWSKSTPGTSPSEAMSDSQKTPYPGVLDQHPIATGSCSKASRDILVSTNERLEQRILSETQLLIYPSPMSHLSASATPTTCQCRG